MAVFVEMAWLLRCRGCSVVGAVVGMAWLLRGCCGGGGGVVVVVSLKRCCLFEIKDRKE